MNDPTKGKKKIINEKLVFCRFVIFTFLSKSINEKPTKTIPKRKMSKTKLSIIIYFSIHLINKHRQY